MTSPSSWCSAACCPRSHSPECLWVPELCLAVTCGAAAPTCSCGCCRTSTTSSPPPPPRPTFDPLPATTRHGTASVEHNPHAPQKPGKQPHAPITGGFGHAVRGQPRPPGKRVG